MRNKLENETYAQYLQEMVDEVIDHGRYFVLISRSDDLGDNKASISMQYIQKNFPDNQVPAILQRAVMMFVDGLLKKQKPVNIVINEIENKEAE
jgi:hypothetical protein